MASTRLTLEKAIVIAIICFSFCFFVYFKDSPLQHQHQQFEDPSQFSAPTGGPETAGLELVKQTFKACMNEAAKILRNEYFKFYEEFAYCIDLHIPIKQAEMEMVEIGLNREKKVYLPLVDGFPQSECRWLTIGIGGSTKGEQYFKEKYPECSFFGADPGSTLNYASIGKVYPFGVGKCPMTWFSGTSEQGLSGNAGRCLGFRDSGCLLREPSQDSATLSESSARDSRSGFAISGQPCI